MPWVLRSPRMKNPRGGWRWEEYGVPLNETSYEALVMRLQKMRRANGGDVDGVEAEICARIALSDPALVMYRPDDQNASQGRTEPLTARVDKWINGYLRESPKFAHQYEQGQRSEICKACPMNRELHFRSDEEKSVYYRKLMVASRGLSEEHSLLGGCEAWGHDNRLAVLLESIPHERKCCGEESKAPMACWMD